MTTEEFIKKVNALSEDEREGMEAKVDTEGTAFIIEPRNLGYVNVASLSNSSKSWHFYYQYNVPGCVLKLMGELAESEYWGEFLILNGEPRNGCWSIFIVGDDDQLYPRCVDNQDELVIFAWTKEELDELKEGLSQRMQKAIDALTVPVEEALKMGQKR